MSTGLAPALAELQAMAAGHRTAALEDEVVQHVASILELEPSKVDRHRNLFEIGFDSLMAIELKNTVRGKFGVEISLASMMKARTVAEIAQALEPALLGAANAPRAASAGDGEAGAPQAPGEGPDPEGRREELVL